MAMLSGPVMFMAIGVLMATGWAMFMADAVAGMLTEVMLTGAVRVTGCCRLTGAVMLTVLEEMVTGLLMIPRFMLAVLAVAELVTGVAEAELHELLVSGKQKAKPKTQFHFEFMNEYGSKYLRHVAPPDIKGNFRIITVYLCL